MRSRPLPCRCCWAYAFPNVFKFFAGFGHDHAGSLCLRVHLYVLQHGACDLVDGITVPAGTPTSPGPPTSFGGPFDTLAVAVQLYLRARIVDVRADGGSRLEVVSSRPAVKGTNAVERAFAAIARHANVPVPTVFVEIDSDVPMAAGLGSSAAASIAGLRIFERVTAPLPESTLLAVATSLEGHADNAAAAMFGGMTSVVESPPSPEGFGGA